LGSRSRLVGIFVLIASLSATIFIASAQDAPPYNPHQYDFATPEFQEVWDRTDRPVQEGATSRTWLWGPAANTPLIQEPYEEADDGDRDVQYTDKSRMEMPWSDDVDEGPWQITQGLLAWEMMAGQIQVGDTEFIDAFPAEVQIAGDPDAQGPTYATLGIHLNSAARAHGNVITDFLHASGEVVQESHLDIYGVTDVDGVWQDVDGIDQPIANVFWDFMTSSGPIYEGGILQTGLVVENPFYAVGYPLTPAFWSWVKVNNVEQNVLIQCFERRCLTYTPDNDPDWQVESGNVGQHYFDWRYNQVGAPDPVPPDDDDDAVDDDIDDSVDDGVDDGVDDDEPTVDPQSFTVSPTVSTNLVGSTHTITVTVEGTDEEPFAGASVSATVLEDGAHEGTDLTGPSTTTDVDGQIELSYTGTEHGEDTIEVTVEGIDDPQTVTKIWADYSIDLDPEDADNMVGSAYLLTATLLDEENDPVDLDDEDYSVSATVSRDGADLDAEDFTVSLNTAGEVEVSYNGPTEPAVDTITVTIEVETEDDENGELVLSASTTKTWHAYSLELSPDTGDQLIDTNREFTATLLDWENDPVEIDDAADNVLVEIERDFGNGTPEQLDSDSDPINISEDNGNAVIDYDGPDAEATDEITVTVTVVTPGGEVDVEVEATKTWSEPTITVTPDDSENPYYEPDGYLLAAEVTAIWYLIDEDELNLPLDMDAFLTSIREADEDYEDVDYASHLDGLLTSDQINELLEALDDFGFNQHSFTLEVEIPGDVAVDEVDVTLTHTDESDNDTVYDGFDPETYQLTNGTLSVEIEYESLGAGTDSLVVNILGNDYPVEDIKEWFDHDPTDHSYSFTMGPPDPDPNPVGSTHRVIGTLFGGPTTVDHAMAFYEVDSSAMDNLYFMVEFSPDPDEYVLNYSRESSDLPSGITQAEDEISGGTYWFDEDGLLMWAESESTIVKLWYEPEATTVQLEQIGAGYNHPEQDDWDGINLRAQVLDQEGVEFGDPGETINVTFERESGGGQFYDAGDQPGGDLQGEEFSVETNDDGVAYVTFVSGRDPNPRPAEGEISARVSTESDGQDFIDFAFVNPELTLDFDAIEDGTLEQGESGSISATIENPDGEDGGINWDAIRFNITVSHDSANCEADGWGDWFEFTSVDQGGDPVGTSGEVADMLNDTFECDTDTGDFVGYWGAPAGEPGAAGDDQTDVFNFAVESDALEGDITIDVEIVDMSDGERVIGEDNGTFEITEAL
jgi:hypothetical protein